MQLSFFQPKITISQQCDIVQVFHTWHTSTLNSAAPSDLVHQDHGHVTYISRGSANYTF